MATAPKKVQGKPLIRRAASGPRNTNKKSAASDFKTNIKKLVDKIAKSAFKSAFKQSRIKGGKKSRLLFVAKLSGPSVSSKIDSFGKQLASRVGTFTMDFKGNVNPKTGKQSVELKVLIIEMKKRETTASESPLLQKLSNYFETVEK